MSSDDQEAAALEEALAAAIAEQEENERREQERQRSGPPGPAAAIGDSEEPLPNGTGSVEPTISPSRVAVPGKTTTAHPAPSEADIEWQSASIFADESFSRPVMGKDGLPVNCALCTVEFDDEPENRSHGLGCCGRRVCTSCLNELMSMGDANMPCPFGCSMKDVLKDDGEGAEDGGVFSEDEEGEEEGPMPSVFDDDGDSHAAPAPRGTDAATLKLDEELAQAIMREEYSAAAAASDPSGKNAGLSGINQSAGPGAGKKKRKANKAAGGDDGAPLHPLPSLASQPLRQSVSAARAAPPSLSGYRPSQPSPFASTQKVPASAVSGLGSNLKGVIKVFWDIENAHLHDRVLGQQQFSAMVSL
jgi:hypothetical protein